MLINSRSLPNLECRVDYKKPSNLSVLQITDYHKDEEAGAHVPELSREHGINTAVAISRNQEVRCNSNDRCKLGNKCHSTVDRRSIPIAVFATGDCVPSLRIQKRYAFITSPLGVYSISTLN